jgi:hypothetical protein
MFIELYRFITQPTVFLNERQGLPPRSLMFFSLYLTCLSFSAGAEKPILMSLFWFLLCSIVLVIYSSILDFVAQLFNLKAQSKGLYYFLGLAYLPYCLMVPLNLIIHINPIFYVLSMFPIGLSFYLELTIIKSVYMTSYWKSFFIWIIPSISVISAIAFSSVFVVGMLF